MRAAVRVLVNVRRPSCEAHDDLWLDVASICALTRLFADGGNTKIRRHQ